VSAHYVVVPLPPKGLQEVIQAYDAEGLCYGFTVVAGPPPQGAQIVLEMWTDDSETAHKVTLRPDGTWEASTVVQA
jgi:hypothetical protein